MNERIVAFEPLESATECLMPLTGTSAVQLGDPAVYAYAFSLDDAVVGSRDVVAQMIAQRFDEISSREFAACTAAHFAQLGDRLPDVNRRAFRLLCELDGVSSREWRESTIFQAALRGELHSLHIPPECVRLRTQEKDNRLEVELSLGLR
jgi:hypothetical protein